MFKLFEVTSFSPLDTRRKLNEHKLFSRRPGRLLNILCTFNLRPVSRGEADLRPLAKSITDLLMTLVNGTN